MENVFKELFKRIWMCFIHSSISIPIFLHGDSEQALEEAKPMARISVPESFEFLKRRVLIPDVLFGIREVQGPLFIAIIEHLARRREAMLHLINRDPFIIDDARLPAERLKHLPLNSGVARLSR
jgi:hypothetical protein